MKKRIYFCVFLVLFIFMMMGFLNRAVAKITITITDPSSQLTPTEETSLKNTVKSKMDNYMTDQSDLGKGFANSNAYLTRVADFNGYHGYDIVGVMVGVSLGIQIPVSDVTKVVDYIGTNIENKLDTYSGVGVSAAINVGLNAGHFGLKLFKRDLYFNFKFFYFELTMSGIKTELVSLGIGANWQLFKPRTFGSKFLLKWRGLSIGTGLYFNRNAVNAKLGALDDIHDGNFTVEPDLEFGIVTNMATIPIEAHTAIQIFWFLTLNAGIGFDLNIGQTDLVGKTGGNIIYDVNSPTNATIVIDASEFGVFGRGADMRFIVGLGINVGPGILTHVDFSYYLVHGFCMNISTGFVW